MKNLSEFIEKQDNQDILSIEEAFSFNLKSIISKINNSKEDSLEDIKRKNEEAAKKLSQEIHNFDEKNAPQVNKFFTELTTSLGNLSLLILGNENLSNKEKELMIDVYNKVDNLYDLFTLYMRKFRNLNRKEID